MSAVKRGALVVAAAGNDFARGNPRDYPGAYPHVLTAAATGKTDQPSSFSTGNNAVDLAAPGESIAVPHPTDPTIWKAVAGTSFSSPIVAAVGRLGVDAPPRPRRGAGRGGAPRVGARHQLAGLRRPHRLRPREPAGRADGADAAEGPAGAQRRHRPGRRRAAVRDGEHAADDAGQAQRAHQREPRPERGPGGRLPRGHPGGPHIRGDRDATTNLGVILWSPAAKTVFATDRHGAEDRAGRQRQRGQARRARRLEEHRQEARSPRISTSGSRRARARRATYTAKDAH